MVILFNNNSFSLPENSSENHLILFSKFNMSLYKITYHQNFCSFFKYILKTGPKQQKHTANLRSASKND